MMSVFLCVKMDLGGEGLTFDETVDTAFTMEGARRMLELPTLQWKIWGLDSDKKQGCGFYLFASIEAAKAYAKQAVLNLQSRQGVSNVTTQIWTIAEEQTHITKGSIDLPQIKDLKE